MNKRVRDSIHMHSISLTFLLAGGFSVSSGCSGTKDGYKRETKSTACQPRAIRSHATGTVKSSLPLCRYSYGHHSCVYEEEDDEVLVESFANEQYSCRRQHDDVDLEQ
jgi:hypothetical protein